MQRAIQYEQGKSRESGCSYISQERNRKGLSSFLKCRGPIWSLDTSSCAFELAECVEQTFTSLRVT